MTLVDRFDFPANAYMLNAPTRRSDKVVYQLSGGDTLLIQILHLGLTSG
jgi:hypothetical protein